MKQIAVIGIGLIGGSLARDIKKQYPETRILGVDNNPLHLDEALQLGLIDQKASYKDLAEAELVILSIPVDAAVEELPKVLEAVHDTTLVMDVGSTKQRSEEHTSELQ